MNEHPALVLRTQAAARGRCCLNAGAHQRARFRTLISIQLGIEQIIERASRLYFGSRYPSLPDPITPTLQIEARGFSIGRSPLFGCGSKMPDVSGSEFANWPIGQVQGYETNFPHPILRIEWQTSVYLSDNPL